MNNQSLILPYNTLAAIHNVTCCKEEKKNIFYVEDGKQGDQTAEI